MPSRFSRRGFLAGSASIVAVLAAAQARRAVGAGRASRNVRGPYGPLRATADLETGLPLILLPEGFEYRSFSWTGDAMGNGDPTPDSHDGMGVVASRGRGDALEVTLVRNHERAFGNAIRAPARYDTVAAAGGLLPAGGTTTLRFRGRRWIGAEPSLGGTIFNCAGGATPWGSWLSCEETVIDRSAAGGRKHGYVFEVRTDPAATTARPIIGMGRMRHEAVAIDPKTGIAYLSEDEIEAHCSGVYRFVPGAVGGAAPRIDAGGRLQAAKVAGRRNADLRRPRVGDRYPIEWVDIDEPDADPGRAPVRAADKRARASGPFLQAYARGALWISRGEGVCAHDGKIYLVDTVAGVGEAGFAGSGDGAIWELDPEASTLRAIFVADRAIVGDNIDNIVVSPRGGMLLCEDGDPVADRYGPGTRLIGLTAEGDSYAFAKNNLRLRDGPLREAGKHVEPGDYRGEEWAGCCFDAGGEVLFVNIQIPGISFAIWGPWERGNL
jgi:secreted PhoX family phosphatase